MAAKVKDFERQNSTESKNTPKRDIVDTNPHAFCAPCIIRTNNTAFLLYGAGTTNTRVDSVTKLMDAFLRVFAMLSSASELMDAVLRAFAMLSLAIMLMDAILRVFAMLSLAIVLIDAILRVFAMFSLATKLMDAVLKVFATLCIGSEGARVGSMRRTSSMKPAYWYGCRPRGLPSLGLAVRAHAGGARPPFRGRNLRSSSGSSFGRVSKGSEGKRFKGEKGEKGRREKEKRKRREKKMGRR